MLLERDIEITFLSHYGQFKGRLSPPFSKNAILRMAKYRAHQDMTKRCELARRFVIGKLMNKRTMLQRYQRRHSDAEMRQAIEQISTLLHLQVERFPPWHGRRNLSRTRRIYR